MNTIIKKAGIAFAVVAVVATSTVSAASVQSQIDALMAQLALLQTGTTTTTTTTGSLEGGSTCDASILLTENLKTGDRNGRYSTWAKKTIKEAHILQGHLNRLGFASGAADGILGPISDGAIKRMQGHLQVAQDGWVGPITRSKINKSCAGTSNNNNNDVNVSGDKLVISGVAMDSLQIGKKQKVLFTKLKLTAGDKDVDVKDINVEVTGGADSDVIDEVLLLDASKLELDWDGVGGDDEAKLKADITINDGDSITLYIAAIMSDVDADIDDNDGLNVSIKVVSVKTDGAEVEGGPIKGASHEIQDNIDEGTFSAEISTEEADAKIGENKVELATITIDEDNDDSNDDIKLLSIKLEQKGDSSEDDIDNLTIEVNGESYEANADDDEYTFNFDGDITIKNEDDLDFTLYADIEDGASKEVKFEIMDVVAEDEEGILLTPTMSGDSTLTIGDAEIKVSSNDEVGDEDIAAGTEDVELASFEVEVEGDDITADEVFLEIKVTTSATDLDDVEISNIGIYTEDGDLVAGTEEAEFEVVSGENVAIVDFGDITFEETDDEVVYIIKGDISTDTPDGTEYEITKIDFKDIETESGEDITDISENLGHKQKIEAAVISLSIDEAEDTKINIDEDDVEIVQITLDASDSGDDIDVTEIRLKFEVTNTIGSTAAVGDLENCEIYQEDGDEFDDSVSNSDDASDASKFTLKDVIVEAGEEKILSVKCDVGDEFENDDKITVTGITFNAEGVNTGEEFDDVSITTESENATVTTGSAELSISTSDENDNKAVKDTAKNVVLGHYEFEADDAEMTIDKITATFSADISALIKGNDIELYIDGDLKDTEDLDSTGNKVEFDNISETVDADEEVTIEFRADMDGDGSIEITTVDLTVEEAGVTVGSLAVTSPVITVAEALPVISAVGDGKLEIVETLEEDATIHEFKIKADGDDLKLTGIKYKTNLKNTTLEGVELVVYSDSDYDNEVESINIADITALVSMSNMEISEGDTYYFVLKADIHATTGASATIEVEDAIGSVVFDPAVNSDLLLEDDIKFVVTSKL